MGNSTVLDVLILYNSASATKATGSHAYAYFLEICAKRGLTAGFSTSSEIIGPGTCQSYWTIKQGKWCKHNTTCTSHLIYDKFSPRSPLGQKQRDLLFSSPLIKAYNDQSIYKLFFDKLITHDTFPLHAIPTIALPHTTLKSIREAITSLSHRLHLHPTPLDFSSDLILKDRYGAGGFHVYKVKANDAHQIQSLMQNNPKITFILQPFTLFDQGFHYRKHSRATDIRLLYLDGILIQSYIRMAKSGDFRCNEHQGGSSTYLKLGEIPSLIRTQADHISNLLTRPHSLYALDFIVSNAGTPYFIEGNTGPGLIWDVNSVKESFMGKKLIRGIVDSLVDRLKPTPLPAPLFAPRLHPTPTNHITPYHTLQGLTL